ncbi:hypothetical protein FRB97_005772 [Tulasnella sp. 331]|nr:hypothetical protein FRB97_005772 [Tulasnella sp. 331]KAG8878661.1 hypothetical protein FRB98_006016 [Tulasnella sp. 332]
MAATRASLISTPESLTSALEGVPYDRGNRLLALSGLVFSLVMGLAFIATGIFVYILSGPGNDQVAQELEAGYNPNPEKERNIVISFSPAVTRALELSLSVLATICTEATGYVHGTTLKWCLAKEGRLTFNANLRLLSCTKGILSVNGPIFNAVFAITVIFSYAASSSIILNSNHYSYIPLQNFTVASFLPPVIFGTVLVLQATFGFIAVRSAPVPTWSSSPLDMASALVHHHYIRHRPKRCMLPTLKSGDTRDDPISPSLHQPSSWESHKAVRRVVWLVWGLVGGGIIFGGILFPWGGVVISWYGVTPPGGLLWASLLSATIQSFVTIGLHCCELVTTLARDEMVWRAASSEKGARPSRNPLMTLMGSWESCGLLVLKPVIHWLFGLSVFMAVGLGWEVNSLGMWFLTAGMIFVAVFITVIARHRPTGPQPAT